MVNNNSAISNTAGSSFNGQPPSTIIPCTIISQNPGVTHRQVWTTLPLPGITPGNDAPNDMNLTFALRDNFGLPTINVALPANIDDYVAGAQTTNTAGTAAYMCDVWVTVPVGINSIRLGSRNFGTCAVGLYIGKAFRYATRIAWQSGGFQSGDIDLSSYKLLCGQRVFSARMYCDNGYFNGGYYLQWSLDGGVTFVDIPVANCHGTQPSQSYWPG